MKLASNAASRAWLVVVAVGVVVVVLVVALSLFGRLKAGQRVLDHAKPALTDERVAGDRAGIDFISGYIDLADPLVDAKGGASRQVPKLVSLVSKRTHMSRRRVLALLKREAPHTYALLRSLPLSDISKELPGLVRFLARTLNITQEQTLATLDKNFPHLAQTITALPKVTDGWRSIPGDEELTRFDGRTPVRTAPELRDYFSQDVVTAVERQKDNFHDVAAKGGVGYIPLLLLIVGGVVIAFGLLQAARSAKRPAGKLAWSVVVVVGAGIIALVLVLQYFPRLGGAQDVIDDFKPVFTEQRVAGDRAGIDFVHQVVAFGDPIATAKGGGAGEVPKLVRFVSDRTGLSRKRVRSALHRRAPKTTTVLGAIPLSAAGDEVPHLVAVLSRAMKTSRSHLLRTLRKRAPGVAQAVENVGPVTVGWNAIPGVDALARFDGTPVRDLPTLDDYFGEDVIPVLENEQEDFDKLASRWPPVSWFPPLLIVVGALVTLYGLVMMRRATR